MVFLRVVWLCQPSGIAVVPVSQSLTFEPGYALVVPSQFVLEFILARSPA
jgi:hypothetical protein